MISQALKNLNSDLRFSFSGKIESAKDYEKITWYNGVDEKTNTVIPGRPDSIPTWLQVQQETTKIKPWIEWKYVMIKSDSIMTRAREHAITRIDNGVADNKEEQIRYDKKIALRATKPA